MILLTKFSLLIYIELQTIFLCFFLINNLVFSQFFSGFPSFIYPPIFSPAFLFPLPANSSNRRCQVSPPSTYIHSCASSVAAGALLPQIRSSLSSSSSSQFLPCPIPFCLYFARKLRPTAGWNPARHILHIPLPMHKADLELFFHCYLHISGTASQPITRS